MGNELLKRIAKKRGSFLNIWVDPAKVSIFRYMGPKISQKTTVKINVVLDGIMGCEIDGG